MNKTIYRLGFIAMRNGKERKDNPYSYYRQIKPYCEWAAGFNDAERGYEVGL